MSDHSVYLLLQGGIPSRILVATAIDHKVPSLTKLSWDLLRLWYSSKMRKPLAIGYLYDTLIVRCKYNISLSGSRAELPSRKQKQLPSSAPTTPHDRGLKSTKRLRHSRKPTNLTKVDGWVRRFGFGYKAHISDLNQHASRYSREGQPKIHLPRFNGTLSNIC